MYETPPEYNYADQKGKTEFNMSMMYMEHLRHLFDQENYYSTNDEYGAWFKTVCSVYRGVSILVAKRPKELEELHNKYYEAKKVYTEWKNFEHNTQRNQKNGMRRRNPHDVHEAINQFSVYCRVLLQKNETIFTMKAGHSDALRID
jgi:hypothetical protein